MTYPVHCWNTCNGCVRALWTEKLWGLSTQVKATWSTILNGHCWYSSKAETHRKLSVPCCSLVHCIEAGRWLPLDPLSEFLKEYLAIQHSCALKLQCQVVIKRHNKITKINNSTSKKLFWTYKNIKLYNFTLVVTYATATTRCQWMARHRLAAAVSVSVFSRYIPLSQKKC